MNDLVERILAEIAQDELWALAASAPDTCDGESEPPVPGGVHWTWAAGSQWTPIPVDPTLSYIAEGYDDGDGSYSQPVLRTVEEWPFHWTNANTMHPNKICEGEEVRVGDGGHIVRHDPARVLLEVAAKRRILERHKGTTYLPPGSPDRETCRECDEFMPCEEILILASIYFPKEFPL